MGTAVDAITLRNEGPVVVADFTRGELKDEREILRLLERLGEVASKRSGVKLLLNMANVTYISSSGLGALVSLCKKVTRQGGVLKVCCLQPDVKEVFEVMHLSKVFALFEREEQALESFQ